ncbi:hypothetical protein [Gordonia hongkongensis]|uniref:hypothetical protein n=1 Tax=Gordonia hongkongensis TaxID=1701090 RepID=UPI003D74DE18
MATAFVERCKATYYAVRDAQLQRADEFAVGYDTDRDVYFDKVEPRVRYRDVIVAVAAELRAERAAERAELEFWQRAEAEHFATYVDDAMTEVVTEDSAQLFRTRFLGAVWSALQLPRRAVSVPVARRPSGRLSRRVPAGRCSRPGGRRGADVLVGRARSGGRGPPRHHSPTPTTSSSHLVEGSAMFAVILFAALILVFVVSASSPTPHPSSERTRGTHRPRLGESLAARREAAELDYMDLFSSMSLREARGELARLTALYDEAEQDDDPYERFIQVRNDLGLAVRYYEHCMERRVAVTAIAA